MPIQQHPIPQEVAGYKFRLIGDMTVKQFIWLAAGILLGILFYSLPLPFFFKYPLAAISVALGAGTAFLPIQGRPMDKWLIAFVKSIYSPTQYVWQKGETTAPTVKAVIPPPITPPQAPTPTPTPTPPTPPVPAPTREVTVPTEETTKVAVVPTSKVDLPAGKQRVGQGGVPVSPPPPTPSPYQGEGRGEVGVKPAGPEAPTQRLPIPFTPTTPNTLVGMTLTPEGKILPAALVEVKLRGNTIRATKSNQLGQFLFAKPLDNGLYQIATEKEGYTFDTYSIDLKGQIIKPLKLQAKV